MKRKLIVIGNGMAGARTVEEILARGGGDGFDITIIGEEAHGNYNRILLSGVLNGSQNVQDIFLNPLDWYLEHGITLRAATRVTQIDRENRTVTTHEGEFLSYDKLIIATGSRPHIPPLDGLLTQEGHPLPGVFSFRNLDDCTRIASYASKCRQAVVVGGGLLGLEAARGLLNHGARVHVVHISPHLMSLQLDAAAGAILKSGMEKLGVVVHLEKTTTGLLGEEMLTGLRFEDGSTLPCDMVVMACGIRPNVELGAACGLTVERGLLVDDQMRSVADEDVYVVGECAQHRGRVYGLVAPLWDQAQVLAEHITGRNPEAAYSGSRLATKLKVMGVELCSMGVTSAEREGDEEVLFAQPQRGIYKKLVIRNDRLIGAILLGDQGPAATLLQAFDRNTPLPEDRLPLLFDLEKPEKPAQLALLEMPDEARVCNCNGVSKGAIRKCVLSGQKSLLGVMQATRAGTGCGSCKLLVKEIVEWAAEGQVEPDALVPVTSAEVDAGHLHSPDELRKIADVADKYNASMIKMSGNQKIDLLGVSKADLLAVWEEMR